MNTPATRPHQAWLPWFAPWLLPLLLFVHTPPSLGASGEAPSAEQRVAQWCQTFQTCQRVLPGAQQFETHLLPTPHLLGLRPKPGGGQEIVGYVVLSDPAPGYSGHPLRVLIGLDYNGRYTGLLVEHQAEPALRTGFANQHLQAFLDRYKGLLAGQIPRAEDEDNGTRDGMTGATVTVLAINRTIAHNSQRLAYMLHIPGFGQLGLRPVGDEFEAPGISTRDIWHQRGRSSLVLGLVMLLLSCLYWQRDTLARWAAREGRPLLPGLRQVIWLFSVTYLGFHALAQVSITQVLTWFHALVDDWRWELFLSEPLIFMCWVFIITTTLIWGRGLFCGWLCPFGALTALLHQLARLLGLGRFQFQLPMALHRPLSKIKYVLFLALLLGGLFGNTELDWLSALEPFDTVFHPVGENGHIPGIGFAALILGLSLLMERPYCKYICPLGAALAMPSTFRWFGLKRKLECLECNSCAKRCQAQAIDHNGNIDNRECMACLDCQRTFYDPQICPPLLVEKRYRDRVHIPLTPIDPRGYYTPAPSERLFASQEPKP